MNMQTFLLGLPVVAALVDTRWSLSLIIGQLQSTDGLGLPLAMFSPSGGVAKVPPWFPAGWAAAGALNVPLEVQFSADVLPKSSEEPLMRTASRRVVTRCAAPEWLDVPTRGVAWGMLPLSKIEAMVVWCVDLPRGARELLPADTRLFCSTQVWVSSEVDRLTALLNDLRRQLSQPAGPRDDRRALQARITALERGLPSAAAQTIGVEGAPGGGSVLLSTRGQLSVQRLAAPGFSMRTPLANPFESVAEFGVVGSFALEAQSATPAIESELATEVESWSDPTGLGLLEAEAFEVDSAGT